jgi:putative Ca2+/H+ antiporter (TMEM165/GDT1 family)
MARAADHLIRIGETDNAASSAGRLTHALSCQFRPRTFSMLEAFGVSTGLVALAEIGDKTQLLAIVLAARFRKPVPIILGILCATLLNHAAAASLGFLIADWLTGHIFQIAVGIGFIAMAAWALIPDKEDDRAHDANAGGVFLTTLAAFFLVEIGDKTQIATSLLAARFENVLVVTAGTTLGMMLANVPAVFLGEAATRIVPLHVVRTGAAVVFAAIGVWVIVAALI